MLPVSDIDEAAARTVAERLGAGATAHRLDVTNAAETATVMDAAAAKRWAAWISFAPMPASPP